MRQRARGDVSQFSTVAMPWALAALLAGCGWLSARHYRALPRVTGRHRREGGAGPAPTTVVAREGEAAGEAGLAPAAATGETAQDGRDPMAGAADVSKGGRYLLAEQVGTWPRVSVIVPARDEERNLPALLSSLLALDYPDDEVIVVDDASTDATGAIAEEFVARSGGRLRVLRGQGPEPGWTGKNYACALGARAATGDWLLFTDADTEHAPGSLRAALAAAQKRDVAALSLFPGQRCVTFWVRLLLPFAFQQYFVGVRPRALSRPGGPALANGQYFLIRRDAYEAAGGHGAVRGSVIDDVALAGALKRAGYPPLACRGEALVRVRMYTGLGALAEGFAKNSAPFLREQRATGALVVLSTASTAAIPAVLAGALASRSPWRIGGALLAYAAAFAGLMPWERDFGVPVRYALLAPLAALGFSLIGLTSGYAVLTRRPVRWKGRRVPAR